MCLGVFCIVAVHPESQFIFISPFDGSSAHHLCTGWSFIADCVMALARHFTGFMVFTDRLDLCERRDELLCRSGLGLSLSSVDDSEEELPLRLLDLLEAFFAVSAASLASASFFFFRCSARSLFTLIISASLPASSLPPPGAKQSSMLCPILLQLGHILRVPVVTLATKRCCSGIVAAVVVADFTPTFLKSVLDLSLIHI